METLDSLKWLVSEACDALNASIDILSDESLPLDARLKAHDRCLEAHARVCEKIVSESRLIKAERAALVSLMTYQTSEKPPAPAREHC